MSQNTQSLIAIGRLKINQFRNLSGLDSNSRLWFITLLHKTFQKMAKITKIAAQNEGVLEWELELGGGTNGKFSTSRDHCPVYFHPLSHHKYFTRNY